jgi:nitrogen regulatory protein P-II 1
MLKIEAIVRSSRLEQVKQELEKIGFTTFSMYEVKLSGISHIQQAGKPGAYKRSAIIPKTKIEIICKERDEQKIIDAISQGGKTGQVGDGLIYVYQIADLVKIKNGKTGEAVLL